MGSEKDTVFAMRVTLQRGQTQTAAGRTPPPPTAETGPAVGIFEMAPVRSVQGAYRNDSLNTWGGALLHVPEDPRWKYHMFASGFGLGLQNLGYAESFSGPRKNRISSFPPH